LAELFFEEEHLSAKPVKCITQLAGIRGPVFLNDDMQTIFITTFLEYLSKYVRKVHECFDGRKPLADICEKIYSVAMIVRNVVHNFPISTLARLPSFVNMCDPMAQMVKACFENKFDDIDDLRVTEAGSEILEIFASITENMEFCTDRNPSQNDPQMGPFIERLMSVAPQIVNAYISMRLEPVEYEDEEFEEMKDYELYEVRVG
jgi:hypothetical protein